MSEYSGLGCAECFRSPVRALGAANTRRGGAAMSQWNWPSSVEPFSAAVEVFGSTVVAMRSK
jgi:hypothetical protein